ncbi:MAG: DUF2817 domain-containing protein [Myxococcales bacterium]|nr:DUF2817 domain-containing protein [Myxococcales bacterium]
MTPTATTSPKTLIDPPFSSDYLASRVRFRAAAEAAGFALSAHAVGQHGPRGEELTIDVAVRGAAQPERVLVVSSGTHGIEGFYGAAVQIALLEGELAGSWEPPAGTRVVFIHAINPYGFAYIRRVNEDNVDLNRNFVKSSRTYSGAPEDYARLNDLLNTAGAPTRLDPFLAKAGVQLAKHGFNALKNAIAQGQYEFPEGLFFGGKGPSKSQELLSTLLPPLIGSAQRVLHLDFHTGMGKWGTYVLAVDFPNDSPRVQRLRREFGHSAVQGLDPSGVLYEINGSLGGWLQDQFPDIEYDCMLAEYGTHNVIEVLTAMREENRAHHHCPPGSATHLRAKRRFKEAFIPESRDWQRGAVDDSCQIVRQALAAMRA